MTLKHLSSCVLSLDLFNPLWVHQPLQRLSLRPRVTLASYSVFLVSFELDSFLVQVRMIFQKAYPLISLLEEAEITAGAGTPIVVFGKAESAFFQNTENVLAVDVGLNEGI